MYVVGSFGVWGLGMADGVGGAVDLNRTALGMIGVCD